MKRMAQVCRIKSVLFQLLACMGVILGSALNVRADEESQRQSIVGRWSGRAVADSESTELVLTIQSADNENELRVLMDLPQMDVHGWPASIVEQMSPDHYRIVIPSDSGPQPMMLTASSNRLAGTWQMPGWDKPAKVVLKPAPAPPTPPCKETAIEFHNGNIKLAGTVRVPSGNGPFPSVVFVHGSGALPREGYQHDAIALAQRGIASLAYDKRGVGQSEGDFRTADYHELAGDVVTAAKALADVSGIASDKIGFIGTSQGGWVAPLAATQFPAAFVIVISGPVVTPAQEDKWDVVRRLRLAGFDKQAEEEAIFVMREWDHGLRTGDWDRFHKSREAASSKEWFRASGMQGLHTFHTDISEAYAKWYRRFIDYDPVPTLESLSIPVLYIFAREDEAIDAMESYDILMKRFVKPGGNVQAMLFEGYDHTLRSLGPRGQRLRWPHRPENFVDIQAKFIRSATLDKP